MKRYWWSIAGALMFGSAVGLVPSAIAPLVAQAYTARVDLTLDSGKEETYEVLLNRAENVARAAVQRSFDADLLATDVIVIVVGDRGGIVAPIMDVRVSRAEWRSRPDVAYWGEYYLDARSLLGFDSLGGSATEAAASPAEAPPRPESTPSSRPGSETNSPAPNGNGDATPDNPSDEIPELDRGPGEIETPRPFVIPVDPFSPQF